MSDNQDAYREVPDWDDQKYQDQPGLLVSNSKRKIRIAECESCEHLTKFKFCDQCNCFAPAKTWLAKTECPIGRWT